MPNRGTRRPSRLLALVAGAFLLLMGVGCFQAPHDPLRIGTNVWPGYEPLYLARSLGRYPGSLVRLIEMSTSTDVLWAFRNGFLDVAALTLDEALTLAQYEPSLRIILVTDLSNGADAVLAGQEIPSLAALKGRRVGVEQTAVGGYLLARALEAGGLEPGDVRVVPVTEGGHEQAFTSGQVDAIVTFDPTRTRLLKRGARVIFDSSRIPGEIVDVLAVRAETLQERRTELREVCSGWFWALEYLARHPQEATDLMAPRLGLSSSELREALTGIKFPTPDQNQRLLQGELLEPAQRLRVVMMREKLLPRSADPASLFRDPLGEVAP